MATLSAQIAESARYKVPSRRGEYLSLARPADLPEPTDLAAVNRWVASQSHPTAIDLFCGAGGLSLGLQDSGFSMLVGADSEVECVETHVANLGGLGYRGDLTDPADLLSHLRAWGIVTVDLVAGGVPCQPFSRAGRSRIRDLVTDGHRSVDDPRAHLWASFIEVVRALEPRAVLLENVPDLATWNDGAVLVGFREALHELGYVTDARILKAYEYGVPQHRLRLFVVGLRDGMAFEWPLPGERASLQDAIGDLPAVVGGQRADAIPYYGPPRSALQQRMRAAVAEEHTGVVFDHITRAVRKDDAEAFALMPEGGTYADLPPHLRRYRSDIFTDKYKRLSWQELSRSITAHIAKDGYWYIHPDQDRTLSIREAARIQTFPDWFRFTGTPVHRYEQIGNAVPPLLAEALGRSLTAALSDVRRPPGRVSARSEFRRRLLEWQADHVSFYPWRTAQSDPWHVLMAEIALQRSRPRDVSRIFAELADIAPDPITTHARRISLAQTFECLGLGTRGNVILEIAKVLVERWAGLVPEDAGDLGSLPGVGDYVVNAVRTFGFAQRAVLIDSTSRRLVSRMTQREQLLRWQLRLDVYALASVEGPDAKFNAALLALGAQVCLPRHARCQVCPVRTHCRSGSAQANEKAAPLELEF